MSAETQLSPEEASLKAQLMEMMRETNALSARAESPAQPLPKKQAAAPSRGPTPRPATPANIQFTEKPTQQSSAATRPVREADTATSGPFTPWEPETIEAAGLTDSEVEALILKCMLTCGNITGRQLTEQLRLSFNILQRLLAQLKLNRLVGYKADAGLNDYQYELTDLGNDRARRYSQNCTYFGAAPVSFDEYCAAIAAQTMTAKKPSRADLERAFGELVLSDEMFSQLGQALHAGKGLFLYGAPGNGKTSIAQRVTAAYGETIWIPRCVSVFGEIIRLFDPSNHEEVPLPPSAGLVNDRPIDTRWVRIRRPTIVVGGELTMDSLEIKTNSQTGVGEAPLQMKSNGGTFVIDDFGRQRMSTDELLNRWIVPLECGYDFLDLASGRKIQVPFDQLIVFSTNLEPADLVDEAFLRRIPYKLDVLDPTDSQYRTLLCLMANNLGIQCSTEMADYLIQTHYTKASRPLRFCHPRDLLRQVSNFCSFHEIDPVVTKENIDAAVKNYFAALAVE